MTPIYYSDARGRVYEFEASTNAEVFAWFRRLDNDESARLRVSDLRPMTDAEVVALAREEVRS